jgi:glycosyltransferase 2 family protein
MNKRVVTILAAAVISGLALWLSFRNVEWAEIGNAFARANYAWVAAAVANSLIAVYFVGFRWRILLAPRARVSMATLFRFNMIAQYANILMPARVNEIIRVWMLSREKGVPGGFALGTIAIEKIFDLAIFMAFWLASPAFFAGQTDAFPSAVAYVSVGLAVAGLVLFVLRPVPFLRGARFVFKILPARVRDKACRFTENALEAFAALKDPKALAAVGALSLGLLAFQVLTMLLLARALRLGVPLGAALFVLLVRGLGDIPPAAPGRIGIFEYTVIVPLAAFGIAQTPALSYAVMLHLVTQVPKIIIGGAFVGVRGLPRAFGAPGAGVE